MNLSISIIYLEGMKNPARQFFIISVAMFSEINKRLGSMKKIGMLWLFFSTMTYSSLAQTITLSDWKYRQNSSDPWSNAQVPGAIHTDLLRNGVIVNPYLNDNEKQVQWVGEKNWIYRTIFNCADSIRNQEQLELIFEGLDTYADVYLNDSLLFHADNMFRSWRINVKRLLRKENTILVYFKAPEAVAKEEAQKLKYVLPEGVRSYTRKAQYQYGWDWGPKLLTSGIWKPVKLVARRAVAPISLCVKQDHSTPGTVRAIATVKIKSTVHRKATLFLKSREFPTLVLHEVNIHPGEQTIQIPFLFPDAKLWEPNGMGVQPMYNFSCYVDRDSIHAVNCSTGFRSVELIRQKDAVGTGFGFKVNGTEIFARGANIIPPDAFLACVPDSIYENLVMKARDANMNMLRVWGGGVYLPDVFYDYCDKYGIMVWQDFMFACSMVPGDDHFAENVRKEAIEQVERLSSHPCLVMWCGNNESDEGWNNWGWQKQFNYTPEDSAKIWKNYRRIFHTILPSIIDSLDPSRPYWPSSPSKGWGRKESLTEGDCHYWGVWWGMEPFETYKKKTGRFMSEYGFQSMPDAAVWNTVADTLSLTAMGIRNHQKHPRGFETIDHYLERYFIKPVDFGDYTYVSQLQQAYGMKMAIDAHRRAFPICRGTLFWQLNDCWPAVSWSAFDSKGHEKLFYYTARHSFDSLYVNTEQTVKGLNTVVHFDGKDDISVLVRLYYISTDKISEPIPIDEKSFRLKPDTMINEALLFPVYQMRNLDSNNIIFVTEAVSNLTFSVIYRDYYHRCLPKNLKLSPARVLVHPIDSNSVLVSSDVFAYGVYLYDESGTNSYSDNGFNLMPGERKLITVRGDPSIVKWKCWNNISR